MPFPRARLLGDPAAAARSLVGALLVRGSGPGRRIGRIVEVEAYAGQQDMASHARFGRTARNAVMFGPPGHAYVYLVYGMYQCLNVVTGPEGQASAVLVRAVEPIAGLEAMRAERLARLRPVGGAGADMASVRASIPADDRLAAGPGLVGVAFSITRADDGADLCDPASDLRLEMGSGGEQELVAGPRIGIGYAAEPWLGKPWRYCLAASPSISRGRSRLPRTPATRSSADGSRG